MLDTSTAQVAPPSAHAFLTVKNENRAEKEQTNKRDSQQQSASNLKVASKPDDESRGNERGHDSTTTAVGKAFRPPVNKLRPPESAGQFRVRGLQTWSGRIVEIEEQFFTAEISEAVDGLALLAEFDIGLIANEGKATVGSLIYVTARTVTGPGGHASVTSSVRLRHLGIWSEEEVTANATRAKNRFEKLRELGDFATQA
jgi:hypothetical protein